MTRLINNTFISIKIKIKNHCVVDDRSYFNTNKVRIFYPNWIIGMGIALFNK